MLYGLYQSAAGADLQSFRMDTVSNNIANAGTATFKRDLAIFAARTQQGLEEGELQWIPPGMEGHSGQAMVAETVTDFSQGPLSATGSDFDIALMGPGFLRVTDGEQDFLTRRGSLTLNADAELVQVDTGYPVLDENGDTIEIPPGTQVQIDQNGVISAFDPIANVMLPISRLDMVQPKDYQSLQKTGDSLYLAPAGFTEAGPELQIRQGFIEQSGVKPVKEMIAMIETSRAFEANMNLIQQQDNTLSQLLQGLSGK